VSKIQSIRGMNDLLPEVIHHWQFLEKALCDLMSRYGYQEIRFPIVESTHLFKRSIGEATDIVEKEMYTFLDRNQDSLTLRPEGTAPCVRACLEHGLIYNQQRRLFYIGPMFRHERPQKGRYRQFYQFGVEAFGIAGAAIEAELVAMMDLLWKNLGVRDKLTLEINTLGTPAVRAAHKEALVEYFTLHENALDEDSKRRLHTNPLRILDSKNEAMQALIESAPKMSDYYDDETRTHFDNFQEHLNALKIPYRVNPRLVRGLDYYSHTVFEWVTNDIGSQNTVCAGGRYDALIEQLGAKPTPAAGFAMGLERILLLLETVAILPTTEAPDVYVIVAEEALQSAALVLTQDLRASLPQLKCLLHCGGGGMKSQFKKADQSGARFALILGSEEWAAKSVMIKSLREDKPQEQVVFEKLEDFLRAFC
jgi:histidyl-tRNA synthetase